MLMSILGEAYKWIAELPNRTKFNEEECCTMITLKTGHNNP